MAEAGNNLLMMEVPLCPLWVPGEERPRASRRQRPADALNFQALSEALQPCVVGCLPAGESRWSVTAVLSPYSADLHVMVIETSPRLYRPGPERVTEAEGEAALRLWAAIVEEMRRRSPEADVNLGYNWSPRSWGEPEERTGFASIPTKWHAQIWTWPSGACAPHARRVGADAINAMERRLILENRHGEPMGRLLGARIGGTWPGGAAFRRLFAAGAPAVDCRGVRFQSALPLAELLRVPGLYGGVLRPLAVLLNALFRELTELLTDMDCGDIDARLAGLETDGPTDLPGLLEILRRPPSMRPAADISRDWQARGLPADLLPVLLDPVRRRCVGEGDVLEWWRKGFGYALAFRDAPGGGTTLRIMPGLFLGVGGVVEALGVALRRPEDRALPDAVIQVKGRDVCELSRRLGRTVAGYAMQIG